MTSKAGSPKAELVESGITEVNSETLLADEAPVHICQGIDEPSTTVIFSYLGYTSRKMSAKSELRGKLALVTGASGGIGAAISKDLHKHGVHLALTYRSSGAKIDELVKELESVKDGLIESPLNSKISVHQADMAKIPDLRRLFDEIRKEHGRYPHILVSNAGHGKPIPLLEDITLEEWDYTIAVNLTATFVLCQLAIPHMKAQNWGRIILMGSISGHGGGINGCHYAASKGGLMAMVKNLATKLGKYGITINDVAPAMIGNTGLIPGERTVEDTPGDVRNIPVGRLGRPEEVANVVTMLCKTGYMTGQSILLSGGLK